LAASANGFDLQTLNAGAGSGPAGYSGSKLSSKFRHRLRDSSRRSAGRYSATYFSLAVRLAHASQARNPGFPRGGADLDQHDPELHFRAHARPPALVPNGRIGSPFQSEAAGSWRTMPLAANCLRKALIVAAL